jgi:hypothetical protein
MMLAMAMESNKMDNHRHFEERHKKQAKNE